MAASTAARRTPSFPRPDVVARLQALSALSGETRATFWRSLQTLTATRIVIALVLLVYLSFDSRGLRAAGHTLYLWICLAYLLLALGFALAAVYAQRRFLAQLLAQVAGDLAVISLLYVAGDGVRSGLAILYLFPLAGAAILVPLVLALFCTALVALFMLGSSVLQALALADGAGGWADFGGLSSPGGQLVLQAGLYGAAFFAVVLVVNRLANKLIGQEELAARRGLEIGVQQAVNRLVMANIGDGILVVDAQGQVWAGNPAAQQMLGLAAPEPTFTLPSAPALAPLAQAYQDWLAEPALDRVFVTLQPFSEGAPAAPGASRRDLAIRLLVRFAPVETLAASPGGERSVIFLEDVTAIEERAQQLKLASMGRLTASIAHEVRNPLAAIGHASALLGEELDDAGQRRLLQIVADNVARVNRMVEDILRLSRKSQARDEPLALDVFLAELRTEFIETQGLAEAMLTLAVAPGSAVRFDPLHLREVLLNLLGNALRYASGLPGSIRLDLLQTPQRMELHVQDDGPGITAEVRSHLFEPFYTTSHQGTGLGLYLARELCLNNDARLDYEYRFDSQDSGAGRRSSGRFVITFPQPAHKSLKGGVHEPEVPSRTGRRR